MGVMVEGYCHRCRKSLGMVEWGAADFVFHKTCAKADEVYTLPRRPPPPSGAGTQRFTLTSRYR